MVTSYNWSAVYSPFPSSFGRMENDARRPTDTIRLPTSSDLVMLNTTILSRFLDRASNTRVWSDGILYWACC